VFKVFRDMRRKNQNLSSDECVAILKKATSGVLAVSGDNQYPYAVPLSYVYSKGKLYFHCAKKGHKLDALAGNDKVSFCVIDQDNVIPNEYTTYFRSVILFGRARILAGETEKRQALELLAAKYSPDHKQGRLKEIDEQLRNVSMVEITVEHLSGKESAELAKEKTEGGH